MDGWRIGGLKGLVGWGRVLWGLRGAARGFGGALSFGRYHYWGFSVCSVFGVVSAFVLCFFSVCGTIVGVYV